MKSPEGGKTFHAHELAELMLKKKDGKKENKKRATYCKGSYIWMCGSQLGKYLGKIRRCVT